MTLLTFLKLLIKTELTLHATILFLFWSLSSRAHRELVAYLRVLTDGAYDIFIQQTKLKNTLREWMGEEPVTHSEAG